ncbi:MAG: chromate transporter [Anaerolinea sp.]|nr:chromate transporter [Anaerolinea sp.]
MGKTGFDLGDRVKLLWDIFFLFARVALFSWGGGPASLALMQREVTSSSWLTPAEFADAVAFGNVLPGPISPQVSAFIGYKLAGINGAIAAVIGTVVPTTVLMLLLIAYFYEIKDSSKIKAMLTAVRPVVVGLLLWTAYDMTLTVFNARKAPLIPALFQGWDKALIALTAFGLLTFTNINPVFIILGAAIFGLFVYR